MGLFQSVHHQCQCPKCWDLSSFVPLESPYCIPVDLEILNCKPRSQHSKLKNCAFLCMGRCKGQGSLKSFPWECVSYLGPAVLYSSGFTRGSGLHLMIARWQVFSFLGAHWLMSEDCNCWLHFSGLPLLVRNLSNIWETFHDQLLSHGAGRLILVQAKILDMPFQLLNFGPGPINN